MATEVKPTRGALCDTDFYAWAREQAALLRAGRFHELDLEHLTEEVDDLAGALKRSVRSRVRTIIEHLLILQHSPASEPRAGWRATVWTRRADLLDDLTPTLRRDLESELAGLYPVARRLAEGALRDRGEQQAARRRLPPRRHGGCRRSHRRTAVPSWRQ